MQGEYVHYITPHDSPAGWDCIDKDQIAVRDNQRLQGEADHLRCSLETERRARAALQLANKELQQKLNQQTCPFIVMLVDADAYMV